MNYDQIIRELKDLGINVREKRNGADRILEVTFNTKSSDINAVMKIIFNVNKKDTFFSEIVELKKGAKFHSIMQPTNQTDFFKVLEELKTKNISLREISNRKDILELEKEIEKLTKQFKDVKYKLSERKLWLKYLKGKITRNEHSNLSKELVRKMFPERFK